jgi:tripartite-type tricarboxylate transporter receptor subunit TctC
MKTEQCSLSRSIIFGLVLLILLPTLSHAQEYPKRPINILCAFGAGTAVDIAGRVLAAKAEKLLGQPIIFGNNPAGGAMVAPSLVAKEKPDGYHLVLSTSVGLAWIPQFRKVHHKYDDFSMIMQWGRPQDGLVVRADAPYKTLKEFVEYTRKHPGKVTYNSTGKGSPKQVALDFIAKQENVKFSFIPYDADNLALSALMGGHVDASAVSTTFIPYVQQGKLRLLATYGEDKRMKSFPDVPTLREAGYEFFEPATFLIAGPAKMPAPIVNKLDEAFHKAMEDPEFTKVMTTMEIEISYRNPAQLTKFIADLYTTTNRLIKELNLPKEQ